MQWSQFRKHLWHVSGRNRSIGSTIRPVQLPVDNQHGRIDRRPVGNQPCLTVCLGHHLDTLAHCSSPFPPGRRHTGKTVLTYSRHAGIPALYGWKKRMETFITICPVHGYLLCTRIIAGYPVTIFSPDEWRYGNQDSGTGRSRNLDVRRNSRTCKRRVAPPTDGGRGIGIHTQRTGRILDTWIDW